MIKDTHKDAQARMQKSVEALRHNLAKVRTGRATTALVDHIKVNSYGASPELQIRADGTAGPDYGTFVALNADKVPADGTWYRCHFPYSAMIPVSNMSSVQKALYISGAWDSMSGMNFALTNVALTAAPTAAADTGCKKI